MLFKAVFNVIQPLADVPRIKVVMLIGSITLVSQVPRGSARRLLLKLLSVDLWSLSGFHLVPTLF